MHGESDTAIWVERGWILISNRPETGHYGTWRFGHDADHMTPIFASKLERGCDVNS